MLVAMLAMLCVTLLTWGIRSPAEPQLAVVPDGPKVLERVHSLAPDPFCRQICLRHPCKNGLAPVIQVGAFHQQSSIDL
ncbi:MAG: hypothetical protein ACUVRV_09265 [Cyanobacteriota bacterium]